MIWVAHDSVCASLSGSTTSFDKEDKTVLFKFVRILLPIAMLLSTKVSAQEKFAWSRLDAANKIEENGMLFVKVRDYTDGKGLMWYTEFRPYFAIQPRKENGADLYQAYITIIPTANFNSEKGPYLDFLNKHKVQDLKINQLPGLSANDLFDAQKYQVCQLTDSFKSMIDTANVIYEPKQMAPAYPNICGFMVRILGEKLEDVKALVAKPSATEIVKIRYTLPFCEAGKQVDRPVDSYLQKLVEVGALSKQGDVYTQASAPRFFFRSVQVLLADSNLLRMDGSTPEEKWSNFYNSFVKLENDGKSVRLDLASHPEALEREVCVQSPFEYSNQQ